MSEAPKYTLSKFSVSKTAHGNYALIKLSEAGYQVVADNLDRLDVLKIMDDCSKWLDEEDAKGEGK